MPRFRLNSLFAISLLSAVVACNEDSTAPITSVEAELHDLEMSDFATFSLSGLVLESDYRPWLTPCTFQASSGRMVCPAIGTAPNLVISRSYQMLTADGTPQQSVSPNVTSVNARVEVTGPRPVGTLGLGTMDVHWIDDLTASDFSTNIPRYTVNGTRTGTLTRTIDDPDRGSFTIVETFAHTSVDIVRPYGGDPLYPLSGTFTRNVEITKTIVATGAVETTSSYQEIITFNGTGRVSSIVTANGETRHCVRQFDSGLRCSASR